MLDQDNAAAVHSTGPQLEARLANCAIYCQEKGVLLVDFLLGLAIFLYGMHELERGVRKLSDARLRYWLRTSTGTSLGSVTTGIFTTALLQSSSMVSLMVLAFAAAGLLPLVNSIGIILGANLGTTLTGWIVATLGFKLDLEAIALPMFAFGAAVIVLLGRFRKLRYSALTLVGLGLLLFGLGIMKTSMETLPEVWNVSQIQGQPAIIYLLLGVLLAALIQSSSAVMMMALAALNAQILALPEAVALIIGADLGTTSTTALGSLFGGTIKKQLAMAHILFNVVVDLTAFIVMLPLLPLLLELLNVQDPLYSLVAFHTVMNLLGLLAFTPFIKPFTAFISARFGKRNEAATILDKVPAEVSDAAIAALQQAVREIVVDATQVSLQVMELEDAGNEALQRPGSYLIRSDDFKQNYENLKSAESNILRYALKIQGQPLAENETLTIDMLLRTTRSAVYAVKTIKDIAHNLEDLKYGDNKTMKALYGFQQSYFAQTGSELTRLLSQAHPVSFSKEKLEEMRADNDQHYAEMNRYVHANAQSLFADKQTLSTELNVNREVHHGYKALITAVQDLLCSVDEISPLLHALEHGEKV